MPKIGQAKSSKFKTMDKLQQLLNEKIPFPAGVDPGRRPDIAENRKCFSEGYNAAAEECKKVLQEMLDDPFSGAQYLNPDKAGGYNLALQDAKATLYTV